MKYIFLVTSLFVSVFGFSQELLTAKQAVEIALNNNFQIKIASNNLEVAKNNNSWGNTTALPTLQGVFGYSETDMNTSLTQMDGSSRDIPNNKGNSLSYGVNLGWTIFDGLGMFAQKNQLKELEKQGDFQMKYTILSKVADVLENYYLLVQQQQLFHALDSTVVISKQRYDLANNRYKIGKASKLEVLNAQVDLNTDKTNLLNQKQLLQSTKVALNELLARDVTKDFVVVDTVELDSDIKLQDMMNLAKEQNPDIQLSMIEKRIAEYELKKIKANRLPKIDLNAGYTQSRSESSFGFTTNSRSRGWNYGVGATLNIFDGFSQNRNERNLKFQIENSEFALKEKQLRVESQLLTAYQEYKTNLELVVLEEENERVAKQNLDITIEKFRIGTINTVEFRNAQLNYINAQTRYSISRFQTKLSEVILKEITGSLEI